MESAAHSTPSVGKHEDTATGAVRNSRERTERRTRALVSYGSNVRTQYICNVVGEKNLPQVEPPKGLQT